MKGGLFMFKEGKRKVLAGLLAGVMSLTMSMGMTTGLSASAFSVSTNNTSGSSYNTLNTYYDNADNVYCHVLDFNSDKQVNGVDALICKKVCTKVLELYKTKGQAFVQKSTWYKLEYAARALGYNSLQASRIADSIWYLGGSKDSCLFDKANGVMAYALKNDCAGVYMGVDTNVIIKYLPYYYTWYIGTEF